MSVSKKATAFLLLTFALSWGVTIAGWAMGAHENPTAALIVLTGMMFGPSIAALICAGAFEKGQRIQALGLTFRPNWWWLFAWLIPLAIAALSVAATILLSDRTLADPVARMIDTVAAQAGEAKAAEMRASPYLPAILFGGSIVLGALINAPILTLSEELGWRGYLHHLWRPAGFWRASLATGVIWGVWHAPAILLYGHNYPDNREVGVALFVAFCTLLAPIMTLVRDRGGSTWAAGIAHGTINAVGGLTILSISDAAFPWGGIVGVGGFVALALGVVFVAALRPGLARQTAVA